GVGRVLGLLLVHRVGRLDGFLQVGQAGFLIDVQLVFGVARPEGDVDVHGSLRRKFGPPGAPALRPRPPRHSPGSNILTELFPRAKEIFRARGAEEPGAGRRHPGANYGPRGPLAGAGRWLTDTYNTGMAIEQLLGSVSRDVFIDQYYLKLPFSL